jgi:hypothetical protein
VIPVIAPRRTSILCGVVLLLACGVAAATLFEFSWHGDPARDGSIVSSTDSSLRATGTIEIDATPGSMFALDDIISTEIFVTGDTVADFVFTVWVSAGGTLSADGSEAFFTGAGNPFSATSLDTFFGCRSPGCNFNFAIDVIRVAPNTPLAQVVYGSAAEAIAAFRMREISVAEPGSGVLFPLACALLVAVVYHDQSRRRRARIDD